MILWPREMGRRNGSSQLLLRVQRSCGGSEAPCGSDSVGDTLRALFAPPVRLNRVKEVGLTGGELSGGGSAMTDEVTCDPVILPACGIQKPQRRPGRRP